MRIVYGVLLSSCLLSIGLIPAVAQPIPVRPRASVVKILKNPEQLTRGMQRLGNANVRGYTANLVSTAVRSGAVRSVNMHTNLRNVGLGRNTAAQFGEISTPAFAEQVLFGKASISQLTGIEMENYVFSGFTSQLLEGTVVPSTVQIQAEVDMLTRYMKETKVVGGDVIKHFAKIWGAASYIGLLGTQENAAEILSLAERNYGGLNPYVDYYATRILLNLEAYNELRALAKFRLEKPNAMLSSVWSGVKEEMAKRGEVLEVDEMDIADADPIIPDSLQEAQVFREPYMTALGDPSAEITQGYLEVGKGLAEKFDLASAAAEVKPAELRAQQRGEELLELVRQQLQISGGKWFPGGSKEYQRVYTFINKYPDLPVSRQLEELRGTTRLTPQQQGEQFLEQAQAYMQAHEGKWYPVSAKEYGRIHAFINQHPDLPVSQQLKALRNSLRLTPQELGERLLADAKQYMQENDGVWYHGASKEHKIIGSYIKRHPGTPISQQLEDLWHIAGKRTSGKPATPAQQTGEQLLAQAQKHLQEHNGEWYSASSSEYKRVRQFIHDNPDLPTAKQLEELWNSTHPQQRGETAAIKRGEQLLADAKSYMQANNGLWYPAQTKPYKDIRSLIIRYPDLPVSQELQQLWETGSRALPPAQERGAQLLTQAQQYMQEHEGRWYPSSSKEYKTVQNFITAHPDLPPAQQLQALWNSAGKKPRGKKPAASVVPEEQPAPVAENPAEQTPTAPRTKRPRIGSRAAYSSVSYAPDATQTSFTKWQRKHKDHIIYTEDTKQALWTLSQRLIQGADPQTAAIVARLNGLPLGQWFETYNRVIFRGANPNAPKLSDFHLVKETHGVDNELANLPLELGKESFPHITFVQKNHLLDAIVLEKGITTDEIDLLFTALSKGGKQWHIRLGKHEMGLSELPDEGLIMKSKSAGGHLHVHIEQQVVHSAAEDVEISYSLVIDATQLVGKKTAQQVWQLYKQLFGKHFTEKMVPVF